MQNNNNNNNTAKNKRIFANAEQKRFYKIAKAFKIGNILATIVIISVIGKYFLGM
jgi:flagellar basal body L-ring protein FlgH